MQRLSLALAVIAVVLAGGLAVSVYTRPAPGLDESQVRSIVSEMMTKADTEAELETAQVDPATIHPMIESYLMANPRLLERMSSKLQEQARAEEQEKAKAAIADMRDEIFNAPNQVVVGNPQGDVTLVEMFDYNCSYCRSAVSDMAELLETDPNLKVVLKEFPILSQDSVEAARVAVAASRKDIDYWDFHIDLFTSRGRVTKQAALDAAEEQGLSPVSLELEAQSEEISDVLQQSYTIADAIGTSGTPTYIIGNEVIPGAVGLEGLRDRIANMRECGSTTCES